MCLFFGSNDIYLQNNIKFIENHSEFYGCANSCNKFVSSWSSKTIKLSVILLWKDTSVPVVPFSKGQGQYPRVISPLSGVPEITYDAVLYGHLCPRCSQFRRAGGQCPRHARPFRRPWWRHIIAFICIDLDDYFQQPQMWSLLCLSVVACEKDKLE